MVTSVVTNMAVCFAITTTRLVPAPCPDNMPGCCVAHYEVKTETRYEPAKVERSRGCVAIDSSALSRALDNCFGGVTNAPSAIPLRIKGYRKSAENGMLDDYLSNHPVGFIYRDALVHVTDNLVYLGAETITHFAGDWPNGKPVTVKNDEQEKRILEGVK